VKGRWLPAAPVVGHLELPDLGCQAAKACVPDRIIGRARLDGDERGAAPDPEVGQLGKLAQKGLDATNVVIRGSESRAAG